MKGQIIDYTKDLKSRPRCPLCKVIQANPYEVEHDTYVSDLNGSWYMPITVNDGIRDYKCCSYIQEDNLRSCLLSGYIENSTYNRSVNGLSKDKITFNSYCSQNYELCDKYKKALEFANKNHYEYRREILYCQMEKSNLMILNTYPHAAAKVIVAVQLTDIIRFKNFKYEKTAVEEHKEVIKNLTPYTDEQIKDMYKYSLGCTTYGDGHKGEMFYSYENCGQVAKDKKDGLGFKRENFSTEYQVKYEFINRLVQIHFSDENGRPKIDNRGYCWDKRIKEDDINEIKEKYYSMFPFEN
jgi:hypothetical protein